MDDAGYLTRRLVEIGQEVTVREIDCNGIKGITIFFSRYKNINNILIGRALAKAIKLNNHLVYKKNDLLTSEHIKVLKNYSFSTISIRSALTCSSYQSICQYCYGWNLVYQNLVSLGEAVGIIAGQSIGEPGTQMTMRTFHTGGVFSGKINEIIRSKVSGLVVYQEEGFGVRIRSLHGQNVFQASSSFFLRIISWKNVFHEIFIPAGSLILKKQSDFVRAGEKIAEVLLDSFEDNLKSFKSILTPGDGEIFFDTLNVERFNHWNKSLFFNTSAGFLWILLGLVIIVPKKAKILVKTKSFFSKNACFLIPFSFLFLTKVEYFKRNNLLNFNFLIRLSLKLGFSQPLFIRLAYDSYNKNNLTQLFSKFLGEYFSIYFLLTKNSKIIFLKKKSYPKHNQILNEINFRHQLRTILSKNIRKKTEKIYFFSSHLFVLVSQSCNNGKFFQRDLSNELVLLLTNKPCVFHVSFSNWNFNSRIYFSGELLFGTMRIKELSFVTFIKKPGLNRGYLFIYPIFEYQSVNTTLPVTNFFYKTVPHYKDYTSFKFYSKYQLLLFYHGQNCLLEKFIGCLENQHAYIKAFNIDGNLNFNSSFFSLYEISEENLYLQDFLSRSALSAGVKAHLDLLVHNYQNILPYTKIANIYYFPLNSIFYSLIRRSILKEQKFLFVQSNDISYLHLESYKNAQAQFLLKFNRFDSRLFFGNSAVVHSNKNNKLKIQKALPIFLTQGAILKFLNNTIVQQGEDLAILVSFRKQTDDIIQGLPKIEELMELSGRANYACLAENCGFALGFTSSVSLKPPYGRTFSLNILNSSDCDEYKIMGSPPILNKFSFVNLGENLSSGPINPKELTRIFFNFYLRSKGFYCAVDITLIKMQQLLLNSIQAIYKSQDIYIADKHVEIVVKQITSYVQVWNSGDTPLKRGDIINLFVIQELHKALISKHYKPPLYYPYLCGITRSALNGSSFLSAASFQDTRKILSNAAIEGRIDWLNTIKACVITGALIPVGTGFYDYQNRFSNPEFLDLLNFFKNRTRTINL